MANKPDQKSAPTDAPVKIPTFASRYNKLFLIVIGALMLGMMLYGSLASGRGSQRNVNYPYNKATYKRNGHEQTMTPRQIYNLTRHMLTISGRTSPTKAIETKLVGADALKEGFTASKSAEMDRIRKIMKARKFKNFTFDSYKNFIRKNELSKADFEEMIKKELAIERRLRFMQRTLGSSNVERQELYRAMNDKYTVLYKVYSADTFKDQVPDPDEKEIAREYQEMKKAPRDVYGQVGRSIKNPFEVSALIAFASYDAAFESLAFPMETFDAVDVTPAMRQADMDRIRKWRALPLYVERDGAGHIMATVRNAERYHLGEYAPTRPQPPVKPHKPAATADQAAKDAYQAKMAVYKTKFAAYGKKLKEYNQKLDTLLPLDDLVESLYDIELDNRQKLLEEMRKKTKDIIDAKELDADNYPLWGYKYAAQLGHPELATSDKEKWKRLLPPAVIRDIKTKEYYAGLKRVEADKRIRLFGKDVNDAIKKAASAGKLTLKPLPKESAKKLAVMRENALARAGFVKKWFKQNGKYHPLIRFVTTDLLSYKEASDYYWPAKGDAAYVLDPKVTRTGAVREIIQDRNLRPENAVALPPSPSWNEALTGFARAPKSSGVQASWTYMVLDWRNESAVEKGYYKSLAAVRKSIIDRLKDKQAPELAARQADVDYAEYVENGRAVNPDDFFRFTENLGARRSGELETMLLRQGVRAPRGSSIQALYPGNGALRPESFEQTILRMMFTHNPRLRVGDMLKPFEIEYALRPGPRIAQGRKHVILAYVARRESLEAYSHRLNPVSDRFPDGYYMSRDNDWTDHGLLLVGLFARMDESKQPVQSYFWPNMQTTFDRLRNKGEGTKRKDSIAPLIQLVNTGKTLREILNNPYQYSRILPLYKPVQMMLQDLWEDINKNFNEYIRDRYAVHVEMIAKSDK